MLHLSTVVPRSLIWWSMRKLGIEEWLVRAVRAMYRDAAILQAITEEFKTGCPWELLYADDLALIAESLSELEEKFQVWKQVSCQFYVSIDESTG
uniref:Reverse transcriptase domain-containing protein n=1 Tax=Octopus bimaculoides TaxID=37653 RepID=A0A0L8H4V8_OCTBM